MATIHDIEYERGKRAGGSRFDGAYRQAVRNRRELAWTLREQGLSYGKIASMLGYATPQGAYALMHRTQLKVSGGDAA